MCKPLIYIAVGHGGAFEEGAYSQGVGEKDLNIKLAEEIYGILKLSDKVDVILGTEHFAIKQRVAEANYHSVDVYIEIHHNAHSSESSKGFEILYYKGSKVGKELAGKIQKKVKEVLKSVGVAYKQRRLRDREDLYVLEHTEMPAIIIEPGFITNKGDRLKVINPMFRSIIAVSIAEAIIKEVVSE